MLSLNIARTMLCSLTVIYCFGVLASATFSQPRASLTNLSSPFNLTGPSDAFKTFAIYARTPEAVPRIKEILKTSLPTDDVTLVPSKRRREFDGVLFWLIKLKDGSSRTLWELERKLGFDVGYFQNLNPFLTSRWR